MAYFSVTSILDFLASGLHVLRPPLSGLQTVIGLQLKFACGSCPEQHTNSAQTIFAATSKTTDHGNLFSERSLILNLSVINSSGLKRRKPSVGPFYELILPQFH